MNKAKISTFQFVTILIVSRLFSLFMFNPRIYELGVITVSLSVIASALLVILLSVPSIIFINGEKNRKNDFFEAKTGAVRSVYLFLTAAVCLFFSVECITQFEFFMASTIFITSSPAFFLIPIVLVVFFICVRGIETLARMSGFVFGGIILSVISIILATFPQINSVWIEPIYYDRISTVLDFIVDNVSYSLEIILLIVFCNNLKGKITNSVFRFVISVVIILEIISFFVLISLGRYTNTVDFPFYTVFSMAKNNVVDRLSAAFIALGVFMACIKASVFTLSAAQSLMILFKSNKKNLFVAISSAVVLAASLVMSNDIKNIEAMQSVILTSAPVLILAGVFPLVFLLISKKEKTDEKD